MSARRRRKELQHAPEVALRSCGAGTRLEVVDWNERGFKTLKLSLAAFNLINNSKDTDDRETNIAIIKSKPCCNVWCSVFPPHNFAVDLNMDIPYAFPPLLLIKSNGTFISDFE